MVYRLFEKGGHRITLRDRDTGVARTRRFFNQKQLDKIIAGQKSSEDVYIEKYGKNRVVQVVILDLDSEDDVDLALSDAKRCRNYFMRHGNNCLIVESGKKGYHLYIQIAPVQFVSDVVDVDKWFEFFVMRLLKGLQKPITTLDTINSSAGLGGNIRVVGSIHPSTQRECRIIEGSVVDLQPPTDLTYNAVQLSYCDCINEEYSAKKRDMLRKKQLKLEFDGVFDPVEDIDLRDVFREIADGYKDYDSGYAYAICPFHNDNNPSLLITENWYSCSACGEKGNAYTLHKKGYLKWNGSGEWRVSV